MHSFCFVFSSFFLVLSSLELNMLEGMGTIYMPLRPQTHCHPAGIKYTEDFHPCNLTEI